MTWKGLKNGDYSNDAGLPPPDIYRIVWVLIFELGGRTMYGPGEYRPDPSEGITTPAELPPPELIRYYRSDTRHPCPRCGHSSYCDKEHHRTLHDLGNLDLWCPRDLVVTYSQHYCTKCRKYFNYDLCDLAHRAVITPIASSTWRCVWWWRTAYPTAQPVDIYGETTRCSCPLPPSKTGWRLGEKAHKRMDSEFLDWALADFSGYAAADELYDGPFCILSAVANRRYKRILYEVLDHDPNHDDIRAFVGRLKSALQARDLTLGGITTDGSALYREPLAEIFSGVPHQVCQFHVIKDLTKGVLQAVAKERERLARSKPKLKRGRPSSKDKASRRPQKQNHPRENQ
jgi:hypothetical protein